MDTEPTPQFKIREGTPDDATAARTMQAASWLATYPNEAHGVTYEWVKTRTDEWLTPPRLERSKEILTEVLHDQDSFYRIAEVRGKVVGFVHAATNDDGTKELEAIYLSPSMFHVGLGKQLMALADEWIGDMTVILQVATYNERAMRFYEKHGFEKIEGSEALYAETVPIIQMIRKGGEHAE